MDRGPGWSGMILVALVTSLVVVFGERIAVEQGLLPEARSRKTEPPAAPATAEVPALEGMPLAAASELLRARGLTVLVREEQPHPSVPEGRVIGQAPLPGSVLPAKSAVSVTLSAGKPADTAVPALVGLSFDEAVRALEAAQLRVGPTSGPASGEREVERSDPEARALVPLGSAVALTLVASGIPVPKLVGLRFARAKKLIEDSGFVVGEVRDRYENYGDPLVVLGQTPEAGTLAPRGSKIDLVRNAPD